MELVQLQLQHLIRVQRLYLIRVLILQLYIPRHLIRQHQPTPFIQQRLVQIHQRLLRTIQVLQQQLFMKRLEIQK